jgi:hypothetical protein
MTEWRGIAQRRSRRRGIFFARHFWSEDLLEGRQKALMPAFKLAAGTI